METREGWLKCDISDGMLPKEYTVLCNSSNAGPFSFFAPQDYIDLIHKRVKVLVLECHGDVCLIYIPSTPLEGGIGRNVKVFLSDVKLS